MKLRKFLSRPLIGMDIQPDAIRLVKLRKIGQQYLAERIAEQSLPEEIFTEGKVKKWDVLSALLKNFVADFKLKDDITAVNLPASLVRMQHLDLPQSMAPNEIETEIYAQLKHDLPGLSENLLIDFSVLNSSDDLLHLFFAATRKSYVLKYKECLNRAGLNVKIMDVDIYALIRSVDYTCQLTQHVGINIIISINNHLSYLIILHDKNIIFYHSWDKLNKNEFVTQFLQQMQLFFATRSNFEISNMIVLGCREVYQELNCHAAESWHPDFNQINIHFPSLFSQMECEPDFKIELQMVDPSRFWQACGLALREVPRW